MLLTGASLIKSAYNWIIEDAHNRSGIPLIIIGWATVALVVIMIGNFNPSFWAKGFANVALDIQHNYVHTD